MDKNEDEPVSDLLDPLGREGRKRLEEQRGLNEMFVVLGLTGLIALIAFAMFFFDF